MGNWIPCAKRLPVAAGYYWATIKSLANDEVYSHKLYYDNGWHTASPHINVIAWMPNDKPEPYKGE